MHVKQALVGQRHGRLARRAGTAVRGALAVAALAALMSGGPAWAQASDCAVATDQAMAADLKAATARSAKAENKELVRLFDLAVAWWQQAVEVCEGRPQERAKRNLTDSQLARETVGETEVNVACTGTQQDAQSLQTLAEQAAGDKRWQEAALLYRKAESTWDLAVERCTGGAQRVAAQRREQAENDARQASTNARDPGRDTPREAAPRDPGRPAVVSVTVPADAAPPPRPAAAASPGPALAAAPQPTAIPIGPVAGAAGVLSAVARLVDVQMTGGARLIGTFANDPGATTYSGRGKIVWANGEVYDGAVSRSLRHGSGQFTWLTGQRYNGDWVSDRPEGNGSLRFANGNQYDGAVVAGEPQGSGKMVYASGDSYSGQFDRGEPHGQGIYTWTSGQRYDGTWQRGKAVGRGTLLFANGNSFEGEVLNGLPHGQGRLTFSSGDIYRGQFALGVPEGRGTYDWKNGDRYDGGWKSGQKQGQGTMQWRNGDRWEGVFQADAQTAQGTLIRKNP